MVIECKGIAKIRFLEKIMKDVGETDRKSVAEEFGTYLVGGLHAPMTPAILFSINFDPRHSSIYCQLPGNFYGNRSISNFTADREGIKRLWNAVNTYRTKFY